MLNTQTQEGFKIDEVVYSAASGLEIIPNTFDSVSLTQPTTPIITGDADTYKVKIIPKNGV